MDRAETIRQSYNSFKNRDKISFGIFNKVINKFNSKVSDQLCEGQELKTIAGTFRIIRTERQNKILAPDWKASNARKQRLIEEGKVPLHKDKAPNGEEWLVFFTHQDVYKTVWFKLSEGIILRNGPYYKLKCYQPHQRKVARSAKAGLLDFI